MFSYIFSFYFLLLFFGFGWPGSLAFLVYKPVPLHSSQISGLLKLDFQWERWNAFNMIFGSEKL